MFMQLHKRLRQVHHYDDSMASIAISDHETGSDPCWGWFGSGTETMIRPANLGEGFIGYGESRADQYKVYLYTPLTFLRHILCFRKFHLTVFYSLISRS